MKLSLNGAWTLTYFPVMKGCPETHDAISAAVYQTIHATVPVDSYLELVHAG